MNDKKENSEVKKIKLSTLMIGFLIFFIVILVVFSLVVYRLSDSVNMPAFLKNNVFLPAVIINGKDFISIGEVNQNLYSIKSFYENQDFSSVGLRFDFNTEDGKKRLKIREKELLNKMIEDRAIEILSKERGIIVSNKTIDDSVDRKLDDYGNEKEVKENLSRLYGWSINDFKTKIVRPGIYKDELMEWLEENDGKDEKDAAIKKSKEAKTKLDSGSEFDSLAKEISEGGTADSGGRLGWFESSQISNDIRNKVIELKDGEISDVLESEMGYHIVKVNEIKDEDGKIFYDISQIFFPKMSFASWLDEKIKSMSVLVLLADFDWDKSSGLVEFDSEEMKNFEKKSLENIQGDASLLNF